MRTHIAPPAIPGWIIHTAVLGALFVTAVLIAFSCDLTAISPEPVANYCSVNLS